jgi:hypothetical protein
MYDDFVGFAHLFPQNNDLLKGESPDAAALVSA